MKKSSEQTEILTFSLGTVCVVFEATRATPDLVSRNGQVQPSGSGDPVGATDDQPGTPRAIASTRAADRARSSAQRAAHAANVEVRALDRLEDVLDTERLLTDIWRPADGGAPVAADLLRGLVSAASYVAGAFDGGELLGVCVGFWGPPGSRTLHSHIAGVSPHAQGRNLGWALKLDQRAFALEAGVNTITWTYDPLVSRNAHFNINKLGGLPTTYYVNYYGPMVDALNGLDETDRFLLRWDLTSDRASAACDGVVVPQTAQGTPSTSTSASTGDAAPHTSPVPLLSAEAGHNPTLTSTDAPRVSVAIPDNIEALRRDDPDCARQWRQAVRDAMTSLLVGGGHVDGFDRAQGGYIISKGTTTP